MHIVYRNPAHLPTLHHSPCNAYINIVKQENKQKNLHKI